MNEEENARAAVFEAALEFSVLVTHPLPGSLLAVFVFCHGRVDVHLLALLPMISGSLLPVSLLCQERDGSLIYSASLHQMTIMNDIWSEMS